MPPAVTVTVGVENEGGVPEPAVSISNWSVFDVPLPGEGVCTVIAAIPALEMLLEGTVAVNCAELTNCVVNAVAPQYADDAPVNPDPFRVSVNCALPALMYAGAKLLSDGAGACGFKT